VKELMTSKQKSVRVTAENLAITSACPSTATAKIEAEDMVGMVTGLAWTDVGGELLTHRRRDDAGQGPHDRHRQPARRDEGIDLGGGVVCALPGGSHSASSRRCSTGATSTCTSEGATPEGRPVGGRPPWSQPLFR